MNSTVPESVSLVRLLMVSAPWRRKVPKLEKVVLAAETVRVLLLR